MQIIEMYEPDEDLKTKGNKSEKKRIFLYLKKSNFNKKYTQLLKSAFLVQGIFQSFGAP